MRIARSSASTRDNEAKSMVRGMRLLLSRTSGLLLPLRLVACGPVLLHAFGHGLPRGGRHLTTTAGGLLDGLAHGFRLTFAKQVGKRLADGGGLEADLLESSLCPQTSQSVQIFPVQIAHGTPSNIK